jgi:hypothetical protein
MAESEIHPDPNSTCRFRARVRVNGSTPIHGARSVQPVKYILLIYGNEQSWASLTHEQMEQMYAAHREYGQQLTAAGAMRGGSELKPVSTATSVRFANGRPKTMDGPFAETKEQLAGYYVIEVNDLEQAISWAEKMPGMADGTVEIRPLAAGS